MCRGVGFRAWDLGFRCIQRAQILAFMLWSLSNLPQHREWTGRPILPNCRLEKSCTSVHVTAKIQKIRDVDFSPLRVLVAILPKKVSYPRFYTAAELECDLSRKRNVGAFITRIGFRGLLITNIV